MKEEQDPFRHDFGFDERQYELSPLDVIRLWEAFGYKPDNSLKFHVFEIQWGKINLN